MNDVSDHEANMWFLYGYVVRKNISRAGAVHVIITDVATAFNAGYVTDVITQAYIVLVCPTQSLFR